MTTSNDIAQEFKDELERITKPDNKFAEWVNNYAMMLIGWILIGGAVYWSYQAYHQISYYASEISQLAPNTTSANIDKINLLLGGMGISESGIGLYIGVMGVGFAVFGIGLAWYTYRSGNRANKINIAVTTFYTQIIMKHIDTMVGNSNQESKASTQNLTAKHIKKNKETEGRSKSKNSG